MSSMEDTTQMLREGKLLKITQKIIEGKRERSVPFTGRIIKVKGKGSNMTITVRQTLEGIEVDRIFPILSPTIIGIQIIEETKQAAKRASKKDAKKASRAKKRK
ncbi:MAG: 50S ribosomal protein L19 [Candidatus Levybacteria bacterium CG_4_10_14_0_2_um_filter_36_16]|nr:MAG: 50S ribosomal protein L19 [Candidatus Levybacteria bacterium CG10_big_fil_rev_8_21_14_0_10_36_30]PIZ96683.1 MAG: 50S ribosomal protein L19 [Candidatus Levybacteria bacterium CG_4_10_14_0_2_um_filter_36_16]